MMKVLRYTLVADGSSDKTLLNIIKWLLDDIYPQLPNKGEFADFRNMPNPPKRGNVADQIKVADAYYPCDILIYHRDAEERSTHIVQQRQREILRHTDAASSFRTVCVVPVVMMETWLLIDETAIKKAAGNRNYTKKIELPEMKKLESLSDAKSRLHQMLREASGLKGRNLDKFNVHKAVHLVAENIQDFSVLRQLKAFQKFEEDMRLAVDQFINNTR